MTTGIKREPQIAAGKFKATCLSVIDGVASTGRAVTIAKHGKPMARLVSTRSGPASQDIASLRAALGEIVIAAPSDDELLAPAGSEWNVQS
jgi:antitoxin (DNA-binding transcriptional repressor) of toxin-antitoxin stability system